MKITIVYDNRRAVPGLRTGWGFSALVEADDTPAILFDTGDNGAALLYNMEQLGIDPARIGIIVISHAHADHTGGLAELLEYNEHARIYVPSSVAVRREEREIIPVNKPIYISDSVMSTGTLGGIEQSLAIRTAAGIMVVAGCSHPGVGLILDVAAQFGDVHGIVGGFHGFRDLRRLAGLSLICPCHCTKYTAEIREMYPQQTMDCGSGLIIEL